MLIRISSKPLCQCSSVSSANVPVGGPPALLTRISRRPKRAFGERGHVFGFGDVGHHCFDFAAAQSPNGARGLFQSNGAARTDKNIHAFLHQNFGRRPSQTSARRRDQCNFSGDI
jgi:hypothetical protein